MTKIISIKIDAKHIAHRDKDRWAIQKQDSDGVYRTTATWPGNRRSLLRYLEDNNIHPSREAEAILATLPERTGFKD